MDKGGGINRKTPSKKVFNYLDLKRDEFEFSIKRDGDGKITNMDELRKVANTIALYVKAHPDVVARVYIYPSKNKPQELYFAYSNKGVLPNSYIICSSYKEKFNSNDLMDYNRLYEKYSDGFYAARSDDFKAFLKEHGLNENTEPNNVKNALKNEFIQQQLRKAYEDAWNVLGGILETKMIVGRKELITEWVKPDLYDFTDIWSFALCSYVGKDKKYHVCSQITDNDHKKQAWLYFHDVVFQEALIECYKKKYKDDEKVKEEDILSMATFIDLMEREN
ncbi:MAG: hypothetical protein ACTSUN_01625 [Promethearchaeota archaeon]